MTTMQAAVMTEPGHIDMTEFDYPGIGPNELLLKVQCTGICGSDKHMFAGHMALKFPLVAGHEVVGTVAEMGPEAADHLAVIEP